MDPVGNGFVDVGPVFGNGSAPSAPRLADIGGGLSAGRRRGGPRRWRRLRPKIGNRSIKKSKSKSNIYRRIDLNFFILAFAAGEPFFSRPPFDFLRAGEDRVDAF